MEIRWNSTVVYAILILACLGLFIFQTDTYPIRIWGALVGVGFLIVVALDQSWKAFKKQGKAAILVSLKPNKGGHSTIHPDDISIAMSPKSSSGENMPNFMVFATGGFVVEGFAWNGNENFVVCPLPHCEDTPSAFICHTKLRKVKFEWLPDYVQSELEGLHFFNKTMCNVRNNIWFGMTSKLDGTATASFLVSESSFLDQTKTINKQKEIINDLVSLKDKTKSSKSNDKSEQIIVNVPRREY